jgi:soluble lytic murein transglycosylase-like protein
MVDAPRVARRRLFALVVAGVALAIPAEPGVDLPDQHRRDAILEYILLSNPDAPIHKLANYPGSLLVLSRQAGIDHCFALAHAEIESRFSPDAVGSAGEVGLYQILPSTGTVFGRRRADLFDPHVNTWVALTYFNDILTRRPALRDALAEYNGGPRNRSPYYALAVLENYTRVLRHPALGCQPERNPEFAWSYRRA